MKYSVKFGHLKERPDFVNGDMVSRGQIIGIAGNSGQSYGAHLHIDCIEGVNPVVWTLGNMEHGVVTPALRQLNYFIDDELFDSPIAITTPVADAQYQTDYKKLHLAYDVVPKNRTDWALHWPRSSEGRVIFNGWHNGYGNTLIISFETGG